MIFLSNTTYAFSFSRPCRWLAEREYLISSLYEVYIMYTVLKYTSEFSCVIVGNDATWSGATSVLRNYFIKIMTMSDVRP